MIIYDFTCATGHVFELAVASMSAPDPTCPACGTVSRRRPTRLHTTGASTGVAREQMPRSWRGVANGDRETVRHWHDVAARRDKLEDRHPELAGDRRPVLAHEGVFQGRPLRAGDDIPTAVAAAIIDKTTSTTHGTPQRAARSTTTKKESSA